MEKARYLDREHKLDIYLNELQERGVTEIALDLEGEFNLHCYGEHLCLVQVFDGQDLVVIDPLKLDGTGIKLLKKLLENKTIKKIMYDCTGDRTLLYRSLSIGLNSVIDLLPAVELLEFKKRGLGAVLETCLGGSGDICSPADQVRPGSPASPASQVSPRSPSSCSLAGSSDGEGSKKGSKKKFQRYDWMKRPIDPEALKYALEDVEYLFALRDILMEGLARKELLESYRTKNLEVQNRPIVLDPVPGILKKRRFFNMPEKSRNVMRKLHRVREGYAKNLNLPPDRVVSNENLFKLALFQIRPAELKFTRQIGCRRGEKIVGEFQEVMNGST